MKNISRRTFFSGCTTGLAGMILNSCTKTKQSDQAETTPPSRQQPVDLKIKKYNQLGTTGLKTSDIAFGAGALVEPGLIRYAYDLGITLFDTDANYGGGVSEEVLGQGLKGVRQNAVIITKQRFNRSWPITTRSIVNLLEKSFKRLQTDYLDGLFINSLDTLDLFKEETIFETFSQLKKEGKVRFTGFSTHNEPLSLAECVKPEYREFTDAVMFRYNHMEGKVFEPLIATLRDKGIGTIAMKTLAGGKQGSLKDFVNDRTSYAQAAIGWVLQNRHIDCAVLSLETYALVEQYVAASGKKLSRPDLALLKKYRSAVKTTYCRVCCTTCEGSCPHQVAISDIMRYAMYFEDYGHQGKAIKQYATLAPTQKPLLCHSCQGYCTTACPYGLQVQAKLLQTHKLLTV